MVAAGRAESAGTAQWNITQLGKRLTSATAARPITRATAERVLREFMCRVEVVNRNDYYLGKVAAVVVFGSMLSPTVDRLSDLDVAVEVVPKESDPARASAANERRASKLERNGYRFRNVIDRHVCWYREVITFLKSRSRVISLANLRAEGELILSVPHRVVYAEPEWKPYTPPEFQPSSVPNDPDCPF